MKRPSIPFKPAAASIHPTARRVERDRLTAIGHSTMTEAELIAALERDLGIEPGSLFGDKRRGNSEGSRR